jgi:tRNA(Arg) A34 adenosine deaminase TadA
LIGEDNDPEKWAAKDEGLEDKRDDYLQHAETNAIHFSTDDDLSHTIVYVSCLPCERCCVKLIQKRVTAVVYNITQEKYKEPSLSLFKSLPEYLSCTHKKTIYTFFNLHLIDPLMILNLKKMEYQDVSKFLDMKQS